MKMPTMYDLAIPLLVFVSLMIVTAFYLYPQKRPGYDNSNKLKSISDSLSYFKAENEALGLRLVELGRQNDKQATSQATGDTRTPKASTETLKAR